MTKKVIIIDDSLISLNIIKTVFASENWEVYGAQNAKNALEMVFDVAPDVIITDAIMPVMGGFQLLKTLRNNPITSKIPVIVYSVLDDRNAKFYVKEERAEYYIQKTDNTDELIKIANIAVRNHPMSQEYKLNILKANVQFNNFIEDYAKPKEIVKYPALDFDELEKKFKKNYDFTRADDKILSDIFSILYSILEYDLALVCIDSFEKNHKMIYFDIRDIILSPIFQNNSLL